MAVALPTPEAGLAKRPRIAFQMGAGAAPRCGAQQVVLAAFEDRSEDDPSSGSQAVAAEDIIGGVFREQFEQSFSLQRVASGLSASGASLATSSPAFERYRGSLRARSSPIYRRYAALLGGERGLFEGAEHGLAALGLSQMGEVVDVMVQLADLRTEQLQLLRRQRPAHLSDDAALSEEDTRRPTAEGGDLAHAARELFEALCVSVAAATRAHQGISSEVYSDALRRQWRRGAAQRWAQGENLGSDSEGMEFAAARAVALFRMKDTVASLYAWGLLTEATATELVKLVRAEATDLGAQAKAELVGVPVRIIDPIAGTGLHAAIFRAAGAKVVLADSVGGGSTQTSGADMQWIAQCSFPGTVGAHAVAPSPLAGAPDAPNKVFWEEAERRCVFDGGAEACEWWQRHSLSRVGSPAAGGPVAATREGAIEVSEDVLLLSFPPPPPSTVAEACLQRFGGRWVAFLGEWRGCTGTAAFFDALERDWDVHQKLEIPRWPMMDDCLYLLRRRPR